MSTDDDAMVDEFDVVARWTADAVAELGPEYAVPAGCRGSGSPAALHWLAARLELEPGTTLLDCGAGLGGASEFAVRSYGNRVVLAEPMRGACAAAKALFDRPVVCALGEDLPFRDDAFHVAWSLGVLCTSTDQPGLLTELRRVVRSDGRLGLLVYVQRRILRQQPEGNDFPTDAGLRELVSATGLRIEDEAPLAEFPAASAEWQRRADLVDEVVRRDHAQDARWQRAAQQEQQIADLIKAGDVYGQLLVLRRGLERGPHPMPVLPNTRSSSGRPAEDASVAEVDIVVAHRDRATVRIGELFLKIDTDQRNAATEVAAMALAPVPTPDVVWHQPPVLALAAVRGTPLGRLGEPSLASPAAWAAAGAAARSLHQAALPPWPGQDLDDLAQQLDQECQWLVADNVLPAELVRRNREVAQAALRPWTPAFIHGDLQVSDVFLEADVVTGVLDWSEAGPGDALYDLAVLTLGSRGSAGAGAQRLRRAGRP